MSDDPEAAIGMLFQLVFFGMFAAIILMYILVPLSYLIGRLWDWFDYKFDPTGRHARSRLRAKELQHRKLLERIEKRERDVYGQVLSNTEYTINRKGTK